MRTSLPFALVFFASAAACGPSLGWRVIDAPALQSSQRCAQGPFELHAHAYGSRWGETLALRAHTDHAIRGHWQMEVDGHAEGHGDFEGRAPAVYATTTNGTTLATPVKQPDAANTFCVASPAAVAASGGESVPGGEAAPAAPAAITLDAAPRQTADVPTLQTAAVMAAGDDLTYYNVSIASVQRTRDAQTLDDPQPPFRVGADIRVRIWSDDPNDLQGVYFVLAHSVATPSVPDAEYVRFLRHQDAESRRVAREDAVRFQREADARTAFCRAHHGDEGCWGRGGYDGAVARMQQDERCASRGSADPSCPQFHATTTAPAVAVTVAPPPPPRPDGPPPAPRAEAHPPQPSVHATWVPGYWHWGTMAYGWIAGHWNVPDADLAQDLTVHAPSAPPAPRVEARPASPVVEAVWTEGYWQWNGQAFVWIDGSWQLPPSASARWRPATWTPRGVYRVFDPGRWF